MKKILIAANWKLYITELAEAKKLTASLKRKLSQYKGVDVILMPPAPFISGVAATAGRSALTIGAQNVSQYIHGSYTGYESAAVLKDIGVKWVLIGHSERRGQEDEDLIQAQVKAAHQAGLSVMLCVGELERDPQGAHFSLIERQLSSALAHLPVGKAGFPSTGAKLAIAYEPVWAIGKSAAEACKPADLEEMTIFIRRALTELFDRASAAKIPILYGGSVDGTNARDLLAQGGVSGFLVGRASTNIKSFIEILQTCKG